MMQKYDLKKDDGPMKVACCSLDFGGTVYWTSALPCESPDLSLCCGSCRDINLPFSITFYYWFHYINFLYNLLFELEHGRSDPKDRSVDGTRDKIVAHHEKGDERNPAWADKSVWRHDGFYELDSEAPFPRKRPAFREKKIAPDSENDKCVAAPESIKPTRFDRPLPDNTRREIKEGYHSRGMDNKPERQHVETDERNTRTSDRPLHRGEAHKGGFPSKERFGSGRSFRGRDRPVGRYVERNQHRQSGIHVEKWKHDLFDEANRSPTPRNEDDQIAKVEALLAS